MNQKRIIRQGFSTIFLLLIFVIQIFPQEPKSYNAAEIKLALEKLNVLGTVLYIGAHPDDENTAFLSYCTYGKLYRTGYLALTRGDGGQNLIGNEQAELLGVLRTQELLQARRIDGAKQFFSRAIDFGYTKSPEETFEFWDHDKLLSDVVWVIRKFKPDVLVTRFPGTGEGGHGQHTVSAILAEEAFQLSGDSTAFPEQLKYVDVWSPKRIFWNSWGRGLNSRGISVDTVTSANLGEYNPLLGKSYTEIAAISRSMHKSQGFGSSGWRANRYDYFLPLEGDMSVKSLFQNIDVTWNRVKGGEEINELINEAIDKYDDENPSAIVPILLKAYKKISSLGNSYWSQVKGKEVLNLIKACSGIWLEATTNQRIYTPGDEFNVSTGIVNRSKLPFILDGVFINNQVDDSVLHKKLDEGEMINVEKDVHLPDNEDITQPYWIKEDPKGAMFQIPDQTMRGQAENQPPLTAFFRLSIGDTRLVLSTPVRFRQNDPVRGEIYNPIAIAPPVTANFENNLYLFTSRKPNEVRVTLKNHKQQSSGELKLVVPENWKVQPASIDFSLDNLNEEKQFTFTIIPPENESQTELSAEVKIDGKTYSKSMVTIDYPHIPIQTVFPSAKVKLLRLNIGEKVVSRIGYIMGSGDDIPKYLRELGFTVDLLTDAELTNGNLSNYDAIIGGIRVYNTNERMAVYQEKILDYVKNGGTFVAQYNTSRGLVVNPGPYNLQLSRDRVTEEDAKVKFLLPNHPLLNFPNKISEKDFEGWIQERGLYFPNVWDNNYDALLEMNDTGETPKDGSLLYTKYDKGIYIYTGLSFFRELPAGVPGAYKLFVNLISAGHIGS
ncbi:PIG-L family deacetylase [bacterium BMS3Abin03]|nr:PIG-L family deacetylase [bacterium BMS3Abin03]